MGAPSSYLCRTACREQRLKPGKKISDCDCYDLAAGGPTCMQGARFNTPSDTLVCSYRVALKLRKRTKKKNTFLLERHDWKIQEQNQIRIWNINKVKYIEEVKKKYRFKKIGKRDIVMNRKMMEVSKDWCVWWLKLFVTGRNGGEVEYILLFWSSLCTHLITKKSGVSTAILLPIFPSFLFLFQKENDPFPRCRTRQGENGAVDFPKAFDLMKS